MTILVAKTQLRLESCVLRSELAVIEKQPHHHPAQKKHSLQRSKLCKDLGATGESVFNMHTLHNLDEWTTMKKLVEYLHKRIGLNLKRSNINKRQGAAMRH